MSDEGKPQGRPSYVSAVRYRPWIPFAVILAGLLIEFATPRTVMFTGAFAAAPLVAAALWTSRGTLIVLLASLLVMACLAFLWDELPTYEIALRMGTVFCVGLLALFVNATLRRSEVQLAASREIAEAAQLAILPRLPARIDGLTVAARYQAAHVGARIGGDLYAAQRTPYGVRMLVGDVRGKGLMAVDTLTVVLGAFREGAAREPALTAVPAWIEEALHREGEQWGGSEWAEEFVTAVLAEIPAHAGDRLRVVNCGHPPPLLLPRDGTVRTLEPTVHALPLGLGNMAPTAARSADDFVLAPGSQLLLYTDGVSEARGADGVFYDPAARLAERCFPDPGALLDGLLTDIERHTDGRTFDDMALLAVARG